MRRFIYPTLQTDAAFQISSQLTSSIIPYSVIPFPLSSITPLAISQFLLVTSCFVLLVPGQRLPCRESNSLSNSSPLTSSLDNRYNSPHSSLPCALRPQTSRDTFCFFNIVIHTFSIPAIGSVTSIALAHIHTIIRIIDTFNTTVFHVTILAFNPLLTLRAEFYLPTPITMKIILRKPSDEQTLILILNPYNLGLYSP